MIYISINEWMDLADDLADKIKDSKYVGVFGVPRGGTPLAVWIALKTGLPLLKEPVKDCVIVDDLKDSGRTRNKYAQYAFEVLIDKNELDKPEWIEFWYEDTQKDAENIVIRQLEFIGENPNRKGLIDTPNRVVKMWKELFKGYDPEQKPKITMFDNGEDGIIYDQMITDTGDFYSQCEHHMVPFMGQYWFAYVPNKKILGLSKVARIVDYYSAKLQIQERLVKEIVDEIEKEVQPLGIALVMEGEHLCKTMRGAKKKGKMRTTDLRGVFREKPEAREEFMRFVK